MSETKELIKYKELLDMGIITNEEFLKQMPDKTKIIETGKSYEFKERDLEQLYI